MKCKKLLVCSLSVTVLLLLAYGQGGAKSFEEHSPANKVASLFHLPQQVCPISYRR